MEEIFPEQYSHSYRRLVKQDFTDEDGVAEYSVLHADEATKEAKEQYQGLNELLIRVNITREAMDDDEDFVTPVNFTAVGCILLDFVNALTEYMGWDKVIERAMEEYPAEMRRGRTMGGKKMRPNTFNTSDLNLKHQAMAHFWANLLSRLDYLDPSTTVESDPYIQRISEFMVAFFQAVPKDRYIFFVENDDNRLASSTRRNPLEGSYPYGRTGKSPRDPLPGFCHFKYSKRGEPIVRFIKPGKYTPYVPISPDEVATPYEERGSVLPKGRGGKKYRHIASYSLDELIELGWDGAMYVSNKAKHEASGYYVPFICGYDSDRDDEYEPIDIARGKRAGTIGLPPNEVGLYMTIPDVGGKGISQQLVQIKNGKKR